MLKLTLPNFPRSLWLMALGSALAVTATPLMMLIASLIGRELSSSPSLATLPIAAMIVGTALGVGPAALVTDVLGRKHGVMALALGCAAACWLAGQAVVAGSFWLFCFSHLLLGVALAGAQQLRFAAIELLPPERAASAVACILSGGIAAAFAGPELAILGKDLTTTPYQGAYWLAALCLLASAATLAFAQFAPVLERHHHQSGRPLRDIACTHGFILAAGSSALGFAVMTFVMTATPISMHHVYEHSLEETKWVLQSHIAAMFIPSLISPMIIRLIGLRPMILAGLAAYAFALYTGLHYHSVTGFWVALIALGIGWNFMFVAGTALLAQVYRDGENLKTQALHDTLTFSCQAVASIAAGWVLASSSWTALLWLATIPLLIMLAILVWNHLARAR